MVADIVVTFVEKYNSLSCVAVCNAIIVQLGRIMSILLTGNVWSVSTRVMCGDDYAIISWREVIVERSAVRRQEINRVMSNCAVVCRYLLMQDRWI